MLDKVSEDLNWDLDLLSSELRTPEGSPREESFAEELSLSYGDGDGQDRKCALPSSSHAALRGTQGRHCGHTGAAQDGVSQFGQEPPPGCQHSSGCARPLHRAQQRLRGQSHTFYLEEIFFEKNAPMISVSRSGSEWVGLVRIRWELGVEVKKNLITRSLSSVFFLVKFFCDKPSLV